MSSKSIIHTLLPSIILGNLWKCHNKAVFKDSILRAKSIATLVRADLHNILSVGGYVGASFHAGHFLSDAKKKKVKIRAVS